MVDWTKFFRELCAHNATRMDIIPEEIAMQFSPVMETGMAHTLAMWPLPNGGCDTASLDAEFFAKHGEL